MAVVLPKSVFFHVPKCGGDFIRTVIKESGVPHHEVGRKHSRLADLPDATYVRMKFVFCFVRHPLEWYRSFWAHRQKKGWPADMPQDGCRSDNFNEFVERRCEHHPGFLGELYAAYTGWPIAVDFVGRHENLRNDLEKAVRLAHERIASQLVRSRPATNRAASLPGFARRSRYSPSTRKLLLESEQVAISRYGY